MLVDEVAISKIELWIFLNSLLRYSMGRRSYIVSYTCELIEKYNQSLTKQQLTQMKEELERELESCEAVKVTLGDECDHITWRDFSVKLAKLISERAE
jgi:hypothetical protein